MPQKRLITETIPISVVDSCAILTQEQVDRLFGRRFRLRGAEQVSLLYAGRVLASIAAAAGDVARLQLDAADWHRIHRYADALRIKGPRGAMPAIAPGRHTRRLILPETLIPAWGLRKGGRARLQIASLIFDQVLTEAGNPLRFEIDRTDALAAGVEETSTASYLPAEAR